MTIRRKRKLKPCDWILYLCLHYEILYSEVEIHYYYYITNVVASRPPEQRPTATPMFVPKENVLILI